ncbi:hypothetical protein PSTG_06060 [Puccinia striiformis f. sp. tritici PST-78]|uniref:Uncharacterized protein n=1 Tax=Puccinia striiformis f. sp. tritici PST-78 TaxID=1165861 RepID=A0A0L0VMY9_9BASI|nr:hypothetical protein PSTG_06060 [Puccinia striiformis f. sp. tritici PST-78]
MVSSTQTEPQSTPTQRLHKRKPSKATLDISSNTDDEKLSQTKPAQLLKKPRNTHTTKQNKAPVVKEDENDEKKTPLGPLVGGTPIPMKMSKSADPGLKSLKIRLTQQTKLPIPFGLVCWSTTPQSSQVARLQLLGLSIASRRDGS